MSNRFFNYNDLKFSREYYELQPDRFKSFSIYFIFIFIIVAFIWMSVFSIEDVVISKVIVRPWEKISLVRNRTSGLIKEINFTSNQLVEENQVLFKVDTLKLEKELEKISPILEMTKSKKDKISRLIYAIENNKKNPFSSEDERNYFELFSSYKYEVATREYTLDEYKLDYSIELRKPQEFQNKADLSLFNIRVNKNINSLNAWKSSTLSFYYDKLQEYNDTIYRLTGDKNIIESQIQQSIVRSPITGYILELREINVGDSVSANENICKIIPKENDKLKVQLEISPDQAAELNIGMKIKIRFNSLPTKEYGYIIGEITELPKDAMILDNGSPIYYLEGEIPTKIKAIHSDTSLFLKSGMSGEGRIIKKKKKIYYFILEILSWI